MVNKSYIQNTFGKASATYDQQAPVQKWTAMRVAETVTCCDLPKEGMGLEIGCGTGFLTKELLALKPQTDWLITDLSEGMLQTCKDRVGDVARFQIMDGEHPNLDQTFDVIVSSLAMQWFVDLEEGIKRLITLLKPGGHLVFSTLGKDSFCEWRDNLHQMGSQVGLHDYPSLSEMQAYDVLGCKAQFSSHMKKQPYEDGLAFLRALKLIGANAPRADYKPMGPALMRKALKRLEENTDCSMTYEIIIGHITKGEEK